MRLLPLLIILLLVVSCGKNGSSDNGTPDAQEEEACVDVENCNTVTADGSSVDLLDSVIDASAEIIGSEITFTETKASVAEGDRISCKTEVQSGEVYHFVLAGNNLTVQTGAGTFVMTRLNASGSELKGTWMWKGQGEGGMHVIRTLAVISNSRVILKTHCEL